MEFGFKYDPTFANRINKMSRDELRENIPRASWYYFSGQLSSNDYRRVLEANLPYIYHA